MPDDPGVIPQSMMEALELFCNLPEQSYEQFLSTFTHLSTEKVTADCPMVPEEENKTCLVKLNNRDGVNMDRKTEAELATEGLHNTEDVHVLPGEVEEDLPAYTPAYCHRTQLELSSTDMDHWTHTPPSNTESQSESEDAVPFSLDDTFDYDNVALSHKYPVKSSTGGSS
ncbi:intraflagellar transport-associated protein isoform X5 [Silurus meridionalis]|uniref:intraflagellar transport-associated protein isoform X5 n=1 Tax=Silurus meridionalis TaxID=175797 RepID=UPI001EEA0BA4|nr:intraflagellar transport-associated protein isoform X5 [Silurus meridionalis]XP_046715321.1 intraflagellar transport-associated protein isoform X5 [Silurus meridionalis]XP_046715322.1 intraflagellar transport-associated protein isoform X5 [Silurus meridionalis]